MEVVWSENATLQIKLISELYKFQTPRTTAKNFAKEIISSTLILKKFPEIGSPQ